MDNGFIKLHRKLIDWEWFADSKTFHVFMYLLLDANHTSKKWRGITVDRGQTLTGRIRISEATGVSQQSVRTALANLASTDEITIQSTNRFSIITICNYNKYQSLIDTANQPDNQQPTNSQPATNQQPTTNKNEKKEPLKHIVLPEWINIDSWDAFMDMRKKIKATPTDKAIDLIISKLTKLCSQGQDANEILDQSTMNSWKGVFAVKNETKGKSNQGVKSKKLTAIEAMLRSGHGMDERATKHTDGIIDVDSQLLTD